MARPPNMKAGNDDDPFAENAVEKLVGEPPQTVATSVSPMKLLRERSRSHRVFGSL